MRREADELLDAEEKGVWRVETKFRIFPALDACSGALLTGIRLPAYDRDALLDSLVSRQNQRFSMTTPYHIHLS